MGSQKRQAGTSLKDRLLKEFYRFSFFKAVDLLENLFPDKKPLGQTLEPGKEVVRFSAKPGFAFPPSDISKIEHEYDEMPVDMEVAFMGLIGPSGVLPDWYNELAMDMEEIHRKAKDNDKGEKKGKYSSVTAFFNIFHHRLISLFYLAWKKNQLSVNYKLGEKDRISSYFLSLVGLGTPGLAKMLGLPEESLFCYYSGFLSRQVSSSVAIEATLKCFAGTSVHIQQFIDRIIPISTEDQTQIGQVNMQLGVDAVCGSYVWENQTKFLVHLGPMGYNDFSRFLPSGNMLHPCFSLVKYMVGIEYEFEVSLTLKREEVPPCILGMDTPASPLLGWSTWIKSPGVIHDDHPYVVFQELDLAYKPQPSTRGH